MGCGASTSSATAPAARQGSHDSDKARRQSVFEANIPIIPLTKGSAVQFQPPPNTRIIFIFGGYINIPLDKLIDWWIELLLFSKSDMKILWRPDRL